MPTYITLINFTDQAVPRIKDSMKLQQEAVKKAESMGAKVTGLYMTMGGYDAVAIFECSSDESAVASNIAASSDGNIRTTTLRAFTPEEFAEIIKKLP
jgi:uncharacterized protein with GYD domain